ncbi:hypothetical protein VNO78_22984 [Psophocarpus tetragonolobus]|uniref:Uncharacterized protein n=1 Tax=Psophocarpus tetragonolobus TaxID=3891 RepID=A0AAN9S3P2_PSOTE
MDGASGGAKGADEPSLELVEADERDDQMIGDQGSLFNVYAMFPSLSQKTIVTLSLNLCGALAISCIRKVYAKK